MSQVEPVSHFPKIKSILCLPYQSFKSPQWEMGLAKKAKYIDIVPVLSMALNCLARYGGKGVEPVNL
jgi:hypothetical protein